MTESVKDSVTTTAAALLIHYSFDLHGYSADELVAWWAKAYQSHWVRSAIVEALYQGRYKAISVEQILALWSRRGQPLYHFNHEFERIVCSKFPQALVPKPNSTEEAGAIAPIEAPLRVDWPALPPSLPSSTDSTPAIPPLSFTEEAGEVELPKPMRRSPPENSQVPLAESAVAAAQSQAESEPLSEADSTNGGDLNSATPEAAIPSIESVLAEADHLLSSLTVEQPPVSETPATELADLAQVGQTKQTPIHQFVPKPKSSDFYTKLKAVAQSPHEVHATPEPSDTSVTG